MVAFPAKILLHEAVMLLPRLLSVAAPAGVTSQTNAVAPADDEVYSEVLPEQTVSEPVTEAIAPGTFPIETLWINDVSAPQLFEAITV